MNEQGAGSYRIAPNWGAVREFLTEMRGDQAIAEAAPEARDVIEQVLAEALNNVVEHAQAGRPDGRIEVTLRSDAEFLCVDIDDDGHPMPGLEPPKGSLPNKNDDLHSLPEGGFGWFIIRTLAKDFEYRHENGWNRLRITLRMKAEGKVDSAGGLRTPSL